MPDFRNRVSELKYIKAGLLDPHPGNWRNHGEDQVGAMVGVLTDVGIADALKAYYSPRNSNRLTIIDGHLRQGVAPDTLWPVLILDVTDAEADYILATHDPLSAMAQADTGALDALLASVRSDNPDIQKMLSDLADNAGILSDVKGGLDVPKNAQPNPRHLPLDIYFCWGKGTGQCCIPIRAGWGYGVRSSDMERRQDGSWGCCPFAFRSPRHAIGFVDNEFKAYDHAWHTEIVKLIRPKYATVCDLMTETQCKRASIAYHSKEEILDWAYELKEYAQNVILIPKFDCLDWIPPEFVLGYSVPTTYGGTPLPVEAFRGRRVHLLGGGWQAQLAHMAQLGDDVVSLDNNYAQKIAKFGQFFFPDGSTGTVSEISVFNGTNPLDLALALSAGNIAKKVNELYGGSVTPETEVDVGPDYTRD